MAMDRLRSNERFSHLKLEEFRVAAKAKLSPFQYQRLKEEDLARFIVAREGNVSAALRQLVGSIEWAEKFLGDERECKLCQKNPNCHSHIPIGLEESEQSTIIYGCPARATHAAVDPIIHHVTHQLEYCFALPNTGSRWIWCVDYNGFGLKEALQGKLAARFGTLFNNHMPERLHKILLLNPPSVFRLLLSAAKPFVDQKTLRKLIPVTGTTKIVLQKLQDNHGFPSTTLCWLQQVLNQKLPSSLPPLPRESRKLMLPSLVPVFDFVGPRMTKGVLDTMNGNTLSRPFVKVTSLLRGEVKDQKKIIIVES